MRVLAVGAHPDDIELGAAACVLAFLERGHEVDFLVLTDDRDGPSRRREALAAATLLGVGSVHFAGFPDGELRADRASISATRALAERAGLRPDVVITHSAADSHTDHVEANRLVRGAFRSTVLLQYSIHVSIENGGPRGRYFVEVREERAWLKSRAIEAHRSQASRLLRANLVEFEFAHGTGGRRYESFELAVQAGANAQVIAEVHEGNESSFHRFWQPLIGGEEIVVIYSSSYGTAPEFDIENSARDALRNAFKRNWLPVSPVTEVAASAFDGRWGDTATHLLVVGTPSSNRIARELAPHVVFGQLTVLPHPTHPGMRLLTALGHDATQVYSILRDLADPPELF